MTGWPGVTHGGVLATIFNEAASAAMRLNQTSTSKREAGKSDVKDPESLSLTYLRPTNAGGFYIVRAKVVAGEEQEERPKPETGLGAEKDLVERRTRADGKVRVNCTLEGLDGKIHVKATPVWESLQAMEAKAMAKAKKSWW